MHATTAFHVTPEFVYTESAGRVTVAKFGLLKVDGKVTRVPHVVGDFSAANGRDFQLDGQRLERCKVATMMCAVHGWRRLPR